MIDGILFKIAISAKQRLSWQITVIKFGALQFNKATIVMTNEEYEKYLQTEHWQSKRKEAIEFYGFSCCLCGGGPNFNVHHRNYQNLWREDCAKDLFILCDDCHKFYHEYYEQSEEQITEDDLTYSERLALVFTAGWGNEPA